MLLLDVLHQVPQKKMWGVIVYFYQKDTKLTYQFCGSFLEFTEGSDSDLIEHEVSDKSLEDVKRETELLSRNPTFASSFSVEIKVVPEYGEVVRIGRKMQG